MNRGRLITIEGIDGAGKTTLAAGLLEALLARGIEVELLREPGGVPAAERIRELVMDPNLHVAARTEALLYAAARAQLVEEAIEPRLSRGTWLLLDRFIDSSLAYQGAGRRLGIDAVRAINEFAIRTAWPDRTLLLLIDPRLGRSRSRSRTAAPDRLERERDDFFERTVHAYLELWSQDPERIRKIDAGDPPEEVLAAALRELADLL
ncbi:MAG: dTMP kinase [Solirubrobacterales bacterium]|nr:dTMP kinase [Solirubrobacterales bacterium]MBV8948440.1 dTMP kinase [Solirubrobacterales bacterium]